MLPFREIHGHSSSYVVTYVVHILWGSIPLGSTRLATLQLPTSHSQRLNSGKL